VSSFFACNISSWPATGSRDEGFGSRQSDPLPRSGAGTDVEAEGEPLNEEALQKIGQAGSLCEDVFREVKKAILSGVCGAGAPLPSETDLAGQFGVSRPVVREALRSLQSRGWASSRSAASPKAGFRPRDDLAAPPERLSGLDPLSRLRVDHLAQARELLEPEICRLAALSATEADIRVMREQVERTGTATAPAEKDRLYILFHRLVGRSCGTPL
jgi:DNA-binding FadR family transcriptional regulator